MSSCLRTFQSCHCVLVIILECVFAFNMSLADEQRQGMLQASSSWLTCIWHNVPCADRCRVAVWSSGLYHCKRIRHDWCSGKADSMNYGGLIRGCWKWFISPRNMAIQPHLPPRSRAWNPHSVFALRGISGCIFLHRVCKEIPRTPRPGSIKRKVTVLYAKQNASEKDKVCSSEIGCSRKGAKKMCHVSLLTDALLGMVAVSLAACVTGRVIYWPCVFLHRCQELCP